VFVARRAHGIHRHYAPLGVVEVLPNDAAGVTDVRRKFPAQAV